MPTAPPTGVARNYGFASFQSVNPSSPPPGDKLDANFDLAFNALAQMVEWARQAIGDDGAVKALSIGLNQLAPEVLVALPAGVTAGLQALAQQAIDAAASASASATTAVQNAGVWGGTAGGTANAITLTPSPAIAAYAANITARFIVASTNTGAATVNISGKGAVAINKADGTVALDAGDLPAGALATIFYDGTRFRLMGVEPAGLGPAIMRAANAAALRSLAGVGSWLRYRNRFINPGMQISQERGTAALDTISGGSYVLDGWLASLSTTPGGTLRCAQTALATPGGSPWRLRATVQGVDASLAAGDYYTIAQAIEGQAIADAMFGTASAKPLLLTIGVRASTAGTYGVSIANATGARSWAGTFTIAAGEVGTDVQRTFVIPGDTTGTWANDNTSGLVVRVCLAAGTGFQGTAGWQAGNIGTTASQVNFMGTNGATFDLFDVRLDVDTLGLGVFPPFELPDYAAELARCRRYWRNGKSVIWRGRVNGSATTGQVSVTFDTPMRATPTVTTIEVASVGFPATPAGSGGANTYGFDVFKTANVVNDDAYFTAGWTADARL